MRRKTLSATLSYKDLFLVFLKSGLAFGGGQGIIAAMEEELVGKKRALTREAFLEMYAIGRVAPAGTSASLAVALGHRFGGLPGTVVALTGLLLPGVVLTILLTASFTALRGSPVLGLLSATLLPAATALIVLAAVRFGREVFRPSVELAIATATFVAVLVFGIHPVILLLGGGGAAGILALSRGEESA